VVVVRKNINLSSNLDFNKNEVKSNFCILFQKEKYNLKTYAS
jgi:hypothetical protein